MEQASMDDLVADLKGKARSIAERREHPGTAFILRGGVVENIVHMDVKHPQEILHPLLTASKADGYIFISEAWVAKASTDETPPSQRPDRKEVLQILYSDRGGPFHAEYAYINERRPGGIGPWEASPGSGPLAITDW